MIARSGHCSKLVINNSDIFAQKVLSGIVNPAKVTRSALQNAASVAAMLLTTEAVIVKKHVFQNEMTIIYKIYDASFLKWVIYHGSFSGEANTKY